MLKSAYDTQSNWKSQTIKLDKGYELKTCKSMNDILEECRVNSTETIMKKKYGVVKLTKDDRMNEIQTRIENENNMLNKEKESYNQRLLKLQKEKEKKRNNEIQRSIKTKED